MERRHTYRRKSHKRAGWGQPVTAYAIVEERRLQRRVKASRIAGLQPLWSILSPDAGERSRLQHQIARHDMRVKPVFSLAVFPDRIPQPPLGVAELRAVNVAEPYGEIDVGVVFWASHLDGQIAAGKF